MAWTRVQGKLVNDTATTTPLSVSYTSNVTAGNLLIAIARWDDHSIGASITVSSTQEGTWSTAVAKYVSNDAGNQGFYVAYAIAASSGARTVSFNFGTNTNAYRDVVILEYSGNAAAGVFDVSVRDSAATPNTALSSGATAALAVSGELAIGIGCAWDTSVTWGAISGWAAYSGVSSTALGVYDQTTPSSAAVTFSTTLSSADQWMAAVVTFKPAGAPVTTFTLDTNARSAAATANPRTLSYTVGAGADLLVVFITTGSATNRAGGAPTYNGVALTQAGTVQKAASSPEASEEIWYLLNPPTGSALNISVPNSNAASVVIEAASFKPPTGFTSAFDAAGGANNTSANPTASVTTLTDNCLVVAGVATGAQSWAAGTRTIGGAAATPLYDTDDGAWGNGSMYLLDGGTAGAESCVFSFGTSDDWGVVCASFKMVSSGNATAIITGVASTSAVTGVATSADAAKTITGVSSTSAVQAVSAGISIAVSITGVSSATTIGSVTTTADASKTITGVSSASAAQAVTTSAAASQAITGVSSTTQVGNVTGSVAAAVLITGVSFSTAIGSTTEIGNALVNVTGVSSSSAVGSVTASGLSSQPGTATITGVSASGQVGTLSTSADALRSISGVSASSAVSSTTQSGAAAISVAGVSAQGQVGTVAETAHASISITGVAGVTAIGTVTATAATVIHATVAITGVSSSTAIGTIATSADARVALSSCLVSSQVGQVGLAVDSTAILTSVQALGMVGNIVASTTLDAQAIISGVSSTTAVGEVASSASALVAVTGVSGNLDLGVVDFIVDSAVILDSVGATFLVGILDTVIGIPKKYSMSIQVGMSSGMRVTAKSSTELNVKASTPEGIK